MSTYENSRACIVIPIYKTAFAESEGLALKQAFRIFQDVPIIFFHPERLDVAPVKEMFGSVRTRFMAFEDRHFVDVESYSRLLLTRGFYERFSAFEYMLIYQTDAFVFSDELAEWCGKGFDYIGAPWFKDFDHTGRETEFLPYAGNGGFSLRNVAKINGMMKRRIGLFALARLFRVLRNAHIQPHRGWDFYTRLIGMWLRRKNVFGDICAFVNENAVIQNEDYFFALILPKVFSDFKAASAAEAVPFAFECQPETLFRLNGGKLPFGCHAWQKHSPEFWKKFVHDPGVTTANINLQNFTGTLPLNV